MKEEKLFNLKLSKDGKKIYLMDDEKIVEETSLKNFEENYNRDLHSFEKSI